MEKLSTVLNYTQPTNYIVKDEVYNDEYSIPVLTAGKSFLLGYTNEKKGIFTDIPTIIFDDFTTSFHYVDFPFKVKSSAMKMLTPKRNDVHLKYVYYQMLGKKVDTRRHKRYWISQFSKLKIPLPPLPVQEKIASILDDAAALRDKTEQLLTEYDLLAQSIFLEMFGDPVINPKGWEEIEFVKVLRLRRGFDLPVKKRISGEIPVIGSNGIVDFHNEYKLKGPGIITGRSGTIGKVHFVKNHYWPLNTSLYSEDLNNNNPLFLRFLLLNFRVERFSRGAGVPTLNRNLVHKEKIMMIPLDLQNQFAEKVQLIERQKEIVRQELKESEDLFQALLQQAFKGELV